MSGENSTIVDMTRGMYRRIYAGFLSGRRICSVSIGAEAWFWRLMLLADDYGNLEADPRLLCQNARGRRRSVSEAQSERWITELAGTEPPLVNLYNVGSERYCHLSGWEVLQPAPRNGRRVKRVPGDAGGVPGIPGASSSRSSIITIQPAGAGPGAAGVAPNGILPALPATGRDALMRCRVGNPALDILGPLVSPEEVHRTLQGIRPGRGNPIGVLVSELCKAHHVTLPKKRAERVSDLAHGVVAKLTGDSAKDMAAANERIARIRRLQQ